MEERDEKLWYLAKRRAAFKQNLFSYVAVNLLLWIIWWFTQGRHDRNTGWPWPLWVMLFWGIGLVFDYVQTYRGTDQQSMAEQEYEKLKKKREHNIH